MHPNKCGPGSSVGIATDYGLDGSGSNPSGDEIFPPVQTGAGTHPVKIANPTSHFGVSQTAGEVFVRDPEFQQTL